MQLFSKHNTWNFKFVQGNSFRFPSEGMHVIFVVHQRIVRSAKQRKQLEINHHFLFLK